MPLRLFGRLQHNASVALTTSHSILNPADSINSATIGRFLFANGSDSFLSSILKQKTNWREQWGVKGDFESKNLGSEMYTVFVRNFRFYFFVGTGFGVHVVFGGKLAI